MKVGVFPGSLDPLFFATLPKDLELCYLIAAGSAEEKWVRQFLPEDQCIHYELSRDGQKYADFSVTSILNRSSLSEVWKEYSIEALLITHRSSDDIVAYAQEHDLAIVSTEYEHQRKFEDKLWFDQFMKDHAISSPRSDVGQPPEYIGPLRGRLVVQEPLSFGSSGTYFLDDTSVNDFLRAKEDCSEQEYLIREFVEGEVFGISLFIANDQQAISILRRQCFWAGGDQCAEQKLFAGISWVPYSTLSEEARLHIEKEFSALVTLLYKAKFRGFANFDFILTDTNEVLVIECNPRLSSATPQIFAFPELLGCLNVSRDFLSSTLEPMFHAGPLVVQKSSSEYSGSLMDIPPRGAGVIQRVFQNGLYHIGPQGIEFIDPDIRKITMYDTDLCMVYSEAQIGDKFQCDETIVSVLSNVPLFDAHGVLNQQGQQLVEYFQYE